MSHLIRVGVLRGGPSSEYDVSLKSGGAILAALRSRADERYRIHDVLIDRAGEWHADGIRIDPEDARVRFDVAFNALHGAYGEDGKLQSILEAHGIPFTGSDSLASALGMNKILTKQVLAKHGIKSPYWKEVLSEDVQGEKAAATAQELFETFVLPAVIKPAVSGSSVGVSIVRKHADIEPALREAALHGHSILVEEFISGIESTCGIIENFRGQDLYALPPVEIRPKNSFFDFKAKYEGESEEIVPATFSQELKKSIEVLAAKVHTVLGLRHYSRTDFIIHPRRGIYVLETNTLPGLTEESLVPKSLHAVGSGLPEFADHLIRLALCEI
ncbi:MAG: D-alanine--D-alanine ligase [Candidatus Parcubacteria bacterium]|nr:D-alanine--D-alanine ligase [Candidatus Parcubacteria bacterium]